MSAEGHVEPFADGFQLVAAASKRHIGYIPTVFSGDSNHLRIEVDPQPRSDFRREGQQHFATSGPDVQNIVSRPTIKAMGERADARAIGALAKQGSLAAC